MYLSQAAGYALHGMASLSLCPEGELIYASDIAQAIGASESYLAKVFQMLVRAGLLSSLRGVKGGYALARPADHITVREVIEAVEGPFPRVSCVFGSHAEEECSVCPVLAVIGRAYRQMLSELDRVTIEELARCLSHRGTLESHSAAAAPPAGAPSLVAPTGEEVPQRRGTIPWTK